MRDAQCRPALLTAFSFLSANNLSDPLFGDVLCALQPLTCTAGCLALYTPRDTFLAVFVKAVLLPPVVAVLNEQLPSQQVPRFPVSLDGLTLGLAGSGWGSHAVLQLIRGA